MKTFSLTTEENRNIIQLNKDSTVQPFNQDERKKKDG